MKEEITTKSQLIDAYDKSEKKSVADLCRIVGVSRFTFYYHLNRDVNFKKQLLEKQREHLDKRIAA